MLQRSTFNAFTGWKLEWIATTKENCWMQVKCPEAGGLTNESTSRSETTNGLGLT